MCGSTVKVAANMDRRLIHRETERVLPGHGPIAIRVNAAVLPSPGYLQAGRRPTLSVASDDDRPTRARCTWSSCGPPDPVSGTPL